MGCKDMKIKKSEFVAKTQFLSWTLSGVNHTLILNYY